MRIIAGNAKGRTLVSPKGQQTRPTLDSIRESLFNIIQRDVPGSAVLDLFAGTGALALEALSRGAANAVLADLSRQAIDCIRRNVQALGYEQQTTVLQGDWQSIIERLHPEKPFDLVFLDPPYRLSKYTEMTDLLHQRDLLAKDALLIIEHQKDVPVSLSAYFLQMDCRTYGDTMLHMMTYHPGGNADGE